MVTDDAPARSLEGRVVVITGGNGGIGLGMAHAVAAAGAAVAIWGRNEEKNTEAVHQLRAAGAEAMATTCDVSDEDQVARAMAVTLADVGHVDCLIANAGIGGFSPFDQMSLDEWRRVTAVNLDGAFLSLREATRHFLDRGEGGSLVAVSSVSAIDGAPGMQHYASAKAGLVAMVRGLAVELARHRVRCNAILPGWTHTDMLDPMTSNPRFVENTTRRTPARRWGTPEDMGPAAVYLADPTHLFHTGDCLVIDGGYSIF